MHALCAKCADRTPMRCPSCRRILLKDGACACGARWRWNGEALEAAAPEEPAPQVSTGESAAESPPAPSPRFLGMSLDGVVSLEQDAPSVAHDVWASSRLFSMSRPWALPVFFSVVAVLMLAFPIGFVWLGRDAGPASMLLFGLLLVVLATVSVVLPIVGIEVNAGTDGLLFRRPLRRDWFVRYAELEGMRVDRRRVELRWRDGTVRYLQLRVMLEGPALESGVSFPTLDPRKTAFVARVDEGLERSRAARAPEELALAREGRPLAQWREALESLATTSPYRAAMGRSRLLSIVTDATAEPTARIAALWLLARAGLEGAERDELEVIGKSTANPRVRRALETVKSAPDACTGDALLALAA